MGNGFAQEKSDGDKPAAAEKADAENAGAEKADVHSAGDSGGEGDLPVDVIVDTPGVPGLHFVVGVAGDGAHDQAPRPAHGEPRETADDLAPNAHALILPEADSSCHRQLQGQVQGIDAE